MNAKPFPILKVVAALSVCALGRTASAENTMGSSASEVAPPHADPSRDTGAPDDEDKDASRPPEHLRIGVVGGVGFLSMTARTVVPAPGVLTTAIVPPWASTIRFASVRPSPTPPVPRDRLRSPRKKGEKTCGKSSCGIPMPWSD
jgi:hypothetical protein